MISSRVYESYDSRWNTAFEVSQSGDGVIVVTDPAAPDDAAGAAARADARPVDLRIERALVEQLLNAYFAELAPLLPVVTRAEFVAHASPPPVLLYAMCLVAAARREVPQGVFDALRHAVNHLIKQDDVLSTASVVNVQALLILCMMGDCHSAFVPQAFSGLWIRLGCAIRMVRALDRPSPRAPLGSILTDRGFSGAGPRPAQGRVREARHRPPPAPVGHMRRQRQMVGYFRRSRDAELMQFKFRISLAYGHPYMIDVQDCDARLPSGGDPNDAYMDELVRLSVILGRVLKTIYRYGRFYFYFMLPVVDSPLSSVRRG